MTKNAWDTALPTANGQLLIGSGSGNPTWTTLTAGTNTTITNGAGSVTVNFTAPSGGGDIVLIASATASSSSTIEFTDLSSSYYAYWLDMEGVAPDTDTIGLYLRTSTDNGSTWDSTSGDYRTTATRYNTSALTTITDSSSTFLILSFASSLGTGTQENLSGRLFIFRPSDADYCKFIFNANYTDDNSDETGNYTVVARQSAADVDAIQLYMASGTIATGEFRLYGFST